VEIRGKSGGNQAEIRKKSGKIGKNQDEVKENSVA
jgi:hypothetical protein